MNDLVDLRLHHHIAQEIYRQQMLQRLPGQTIFHFILVCPTHIFNWDRFLPNVDHGYLAR